MEAYQGREAIKPVERIVTSPFNLVPAVDYISSKCPPSPNATWISNPDTLIFFRNGKWIVQENNPKHGFVTQLEISEGGTETYVNRKQLKDDGSGEYTSFGPAAWIHDVTDENGNKQRLCHDGEGKPASIPSILGYINGLLTYGMDDRRSPFPSPAEDASSAGVSPHQVIPEETVSHALRNLVDALEATSPDDDSDTWNPRPGVSVTEIQTGDENLIRYMVTLYGQNVVTLLTLQNKPQNFGDQVIHVSQGKSEESQGRVGEITYEQVRTQDLVITEQGVFVQDSRSQNIIAIAQAIVGQAKITFSTLPLPSRVVDSPTAQ